MQQTIKLLFLLCLLSMTSSLIKAQNFKLEVISKDSRTITSSEQKRFDAIQSDALYKSVELLNFRNFENSLKGNSITIELDEKNALTKTFIAESTITFKTEGYFWTGYNRDGSSFMLQKDRTGYYGFLNLVPEGRQLTILNLSPTQNVLAEHSEKGSLSKHTCGNIPEDGDEESAEIRGFCGTRNIRILYLFSPGAPALLAPATAAAAITAQLNIASTASGLTTAQISFTNAGTALLPGFVESGRMRRDLRSVRNSTVAQGLRNTFLADLVVILTTNAYSGAGLAYRIKAKDKNAYALVTMGSVGGFTGAHEVGHLLGGRHQRTFSCLPGDVLTDNHGFLIDGTSRTVMAQNSCTGARILRWSNPDAPMPGGAVTGNDNNNVAEQLVDQAEVAACFRGEAPDPFNQQQPIGIQGPSVIDGCSPSNTWNASFNPADWDMSSINYWWETSANGISGWTYRSNTASMTLGFTTPFFIRLAMSDGTGNWGAASKSVTVAQCRPTFNSGNAPVSEFQPITITPNPVNTNFVLETKSGFVDTEYSIFSTIGSIIKKGKVESSGKTEIDVNDFVTGMYFLKINGEKPVSFKVIK